MPGSSTAAQTRSGVVRFTVLEPCSNGADAVSSVLVNPPDIVLMDLQMPGMDGFTAIEKVRAAGVPTRVIALTSLDNDGEVGSEGAGDQARRQRPDSAGHPRA